MAGLQFDVEMALGARAVLYGLFQRVFAEVPDEALREHEQSDVVATAFEVYRGLAAQLGVEAERLTAPSASEEVTASADGTARTLSGEYNRLFVGVGKPDVCMWESIYTTGNAALFQEHTLTVRRFFQRFGLQSRDYPRTADDHLAIELAFMREMAIRSMMAESDERLKLLEAQAEFLRDHLGTWVGKFAGQVSDAGAPAYYREYADALATFIQVDAAVLSQIAA